jgi:signal transduction histidine kinase
VQSLRSLAAAKSISLSVDAAGELPIVADESLVRRMLLNLLDNSIKYTPTGGAVSVAVHATPESAEIYVSNNGPGIPPELQSRIFERFFRGDQARTRAHPESGAGLGLSIAKWIAEAHHGTLVLTRSSHAGTVFTARLPKFSSAPTSTG